MASTRRMVLSLSKHTTENFTILIMWFVYILLCSDRSFYTGISDNPQERFADHKSGKGGRYTRSHKPLKIIYLEKFSTKTEALKRERQIKGWSRQKKIKILRLEI